MDTETKWIEEECSWCDGLGYEIGVEGDCRKCDGEKTSEYWERSWKCRCGAKIETSQYERGNDVDCNRCGQWFNSGGQAVNYPIYDSDIAPMGFDESYCGERWDDDY